MKPSKPPRPPHSPSPLFHQQPNHYTPPTFGVPTSESYLPFCRSHLCSRNGNRRFLAYLYVSPINVVLKLKAIEESSREARQISILSQNLLGEERLSGRMPARGLLGRFGAILSCSAVCFERLNQVRDWLQYSSD